MSLKTGKLSTGIYFEKCSWILTLGDGIVNAIVAALYIARLRLGILLLATKSAFWSAYSAK